MLKMVHILKLTLSIVYLTAISIGASVGHREQSALSVLQLEVLVIEPISVDAAAAGTVACREVPTLTVEQLNNGRLIRT